MIHLLPRLLHPASSGNYFRHIILFIVSVITLTYPFSSGGAVTGNELLRYVITYKWGLIDKEAGTAELSTKRSANLLNLKLTARTKPWADRIFQVRDTLTADLEATTLRPRRYIKSAHEGGRFSRDEINFSYSGDNVTGKVSRIRIDKKGNRTDGSASLNAHGPTFDMLSVFYFLRTLDYPSLSKGIQLKATIFSGKFSETLTISCLGKGEITLRDKNKTHVEAWHIRFRFTSGGGKKSSDDMDAWISTDSRHLPLQLTGRLPIGEVRVYLTQQ